MKIILKRKSFTALVNTHINVELFFKYVRTYHYMVISLLNNSSDYSNDNTLPPVLWKIFVKNDFTLKQCLIYIHIYIWKE
jgi:hypothetical protein